MTSTHKEDMDQSVNPSLSEPEATWEILKQIIFLIWKKNKDDFTS